jgi:hypothetical protein
VLFRSNRSILRWALEQADLLVEQKDSKGNALSLGDFVFFKLDGVTYTAIVEGVDPHTKIINLFCPAFPEASVSLDMRSITKLSPEESRTASVGALNGFEAGTVGWHMDCLLEEITKLRSLPQGELTPEKFRELL